MTQMTRALRPTLALCAAALALVACTTEPDSACDKLIGRTQVVVDSVQAAGLHIAAGDSVQLDADVRVVTSARPDAYVGGNTICTATFGEPIASTPTAASADTNIVAVRVGRWLVAKAQGNTSVAVTAPPPAEPTFVSVTVTPP